VYTLTYLYNIGATFFI